MREEYKTRLSGISALLTNELSRATKNKPFNSAFEGYVAIMKELYFLRDQVCKDPDVYDLRAMRDQCVLIAVAAVRFIIDIILEGRYDK